MKTRRMVQALYDLLGCDYREDSLRADGGAVVRYGYRPGLLARRHADHNSEATVTKALLDYLGLEAQEFGPSVRIVKTKKTKGTKRA